MTFLTGLCRIPVLGAPSSIELELLIHIQNEEEMLYVFSTALVADIGFGRC